MALSAAKKASDARHQEKLMQIMVKPYIEEGETIKAAAKEAKQSTQAYILQAVRERMERESANKYYIGIPKSAADQAGQKDGITGKEWLIETIKNALSED